MIMKENAFNWALVNSQRGGVLRTVGNNGTRFVALGDKGKLMTSESEDCRKWKDRAPSPLKKAMFAITFAAGKFLAVGNHAYTAYSPDGDNWTTVTVPTEQSLWGVCYGVDGDGNGVFVAVGNEGGNEGTIISSANGDTSWRRQNSPTNRSLKDVAYGNGLFVAVGSYGIILTSTDGTYWTKQATLGRGLKAVVYGGGVYVAAGRDEKIYSSTDGVSWTQRFQGTATRFIWDLCYTDPGFVAVGDKGRIITSPDGKSWSSAHSPGRAAFFGVSYVENKVVAVGNQTQISVGTKKKNNGQATK